MQSRPRRASAAALVAALAVAVAGCGDDSDDQPAGAGSESPTAVTSPTTSSTPSATPAPEDDAKVVGVTITHDSVKPDGARVKVERNQEVVLEIDAAQAGELHVHSTPEKELAYPKGKSQLSMTFDKAGIVDVEDHHLGKLIVQLEVS